MTNKEWLDYLAHNAPDELAAWFDAEHVETEERALDGDTDALERKSADLIHEYYKPMVAEMQAKMDRLTAERDKLQEQLLIGWECECRLQAERDELKAEHERIVQELVDANTRQCERTNELTAERDNLAADLLKANNERERYREKFGKCIDYADAIHALMDDEGLA